jgi:hypothetical protein
MEHVYHYGLLFATLLFLLAWQVGVGGLATPLTTTGLATFTVAKNPFAWIQAFTILALAFAVVGMRYHHYTHSPPAETLAGTPLRPHSKLR